MPVEPLREEKKKEAVSINMGKLFARKDERLAIEDTKVDINTITCDKVANKS